MRFILISNVPQIASFAAQQGVDLVMLDLEVLGKAARQGHLDTWKSHHRIEDLAGLRAVLPPGALMVRIDPLHPGSAAQIEAVIAGGVDWIMLPMFRSGAEVADVQRLIAGRARLMPLVETVGALSTLPEWIDLRPHAVHIGLNDLHLELGASFMFQPLADETLEGAAAAVARASVPFGIGGLARAGEGVVPPELVLARHVDLGSNAAILSRTFLRGAGDLAALRAQIDLGAELSTLRALYAEFTQADAAARARVRTALSAAIEAHLAGR